MFDLDEKIHRIFNGNFNLKTQSFVENLLAEVIINAENELVSRVRKWLASVDQNAVPSMQGDLITLQAEINVVKCNLIGCLQKYIEDMEHDMVAHTDFDAEFQKDVLLDLHKVREVLA